MAKGKLGKARFCPWCGTDSLVRDLFTVDTKSHHTHVSFICTVCCAGFSMRESPRAKFVNRMYALERKQRPPEKKGGGRPPLPERPLDELVRIEALLAAKRPRGKVNRESVGASLAAVRMAIQERNAGQRESSEDGQEIAPLVEARETQGRVDVLSAGECREREASFAA